jgi:hypothetical protein
MTVFFVIFFKNLYIKKVIFFVKEYIVTKHFNFARGTNWCQNEF